MAAVIATTRGSRSAMRDSASAKQAVQLGGPPLDCRRSPVSDANGVVACQANGSVSAGAKPRPLRVRTWRTVGPLASRSTSSPASSSRRSWPSTGPMTRRPSVSKYRRGDLARERPPTFGAIDMPLSLNTTFTSVPRKPAWLKASKDIPAVAAPSPITATTRSLRPARRAASAIPSAADTEVPACPAPKASWRLSDRRRKPLGPSDFLTERRPSRRPVSTLWPYAWCPTSQTRRSRGVSKT